MKTFLQTTLRHWVHSIPLTGVNSNSSIRGNNVTNLCNYGNSKTL